MIRSSRSVFQPSVRRKKPTATFHGGRFTCDAGVMPPAAANRRISAAATLAPLIADQRDPA
jgi:hypothetical protein